MVNLNPRNPLIKIAEPIIAVAVFVYFLGLLTYNLSDYTGLHIDEAWMGLNAIKINEAGVQSLHGMNRYTGSVYSLLIAMVFKLNGVSVLSLRLPGAIANFIGILILATNAARWGGRRGFWALIGLLLLLPGLFAFARVAWEVCAFHLLLVAIKVTLVSQLVYRGRLSLAATGLFFGTVAFGIFNHFIFISDSVAFLLATASLGYLNSKRSNPIIYRANLLAFLSLTLAAYLYFTKPRIEDTFFQANPSYSLLSLCIPVIAVSLIYFYLIQEHQQQWPRKIYAEIARFSRRVAFFCLSHKWIACLLVAGIIYAGFRFIWSFQGTIANVLPLQRIFAYELPTFQYWVLVGTGMLLCLLFCFGLSQHIAQRHHLTTPQLNQLLFYLYPLFALLILPLLSRRTSSRHFLIASVLLLGFLPLIEQTICKQIANRSIMMAILGLFVLNIGIGQSVLVQALTSSLQQTPAAVNYIGFSDKSKHFLQQDDLLAYLKANQICQLGQSDPYIRDPLAFYFRTERYACDYSKIAKIEYCDTCTDPVKYHMISIEKLK